MGDWAQGEFQVAGQTAGVDYTCLPGLGVNEIISTGGDAFYFPKQDDAELEAAQKELADALAEVEKRIHKDSSKDPEHLVPLFREWIQLMFRREKLMKLKNFKGKI